MAVTGDILRKNMPMQLHDMNKREKYCHMQHQLVIDKKTEKIKTLSYPILCPLCHIHQIKQIETKFTQSRIYFNVAC